MGWNIILDYWGLTLYITWRNIWRITKTLDTSTSRCWQHHGVVYRNSRAAVSVNVEARNLEFLKWRHGRLKVKSAWHPVKSSWHALKKNMTVGEKTIYRWDTCCKSCNRNEKTSNGKNEPKIWRLFYRTVHSTPFLFTLNSRLIFKHIQWLIKGNDVLIEKKF
jgi:hypothetical protein